MKTRGPDVGYPKCRHGNVAKLGSNPPRCSQCEREDEAAEQAAQVETGEQRLRARLVALEARVAALEARLAEQRAVPVVVPYGESRLDRGAR